MPAALRHVDKRAVPGVAIQRVGLARRATRAARNVDVHEAAGAARRASGPCPAHEPDVVGHVQVHVAIAIVVAERAAGAPSGSRRLLSWQRTNARSDVAPEHVRPVRRDIDVVEAVVVVVGDADARCPSRGRRPAARVTSVNRSPSLRIQRHHRMPPASSSTRGTVDDQDVEVAVVVVIEEAAPLPIVSMM